MIRNTNEVQTIADLRLAMDLHRPVTIDYENDSGIRRVRKVEIFEIVDREHASKRPFFRAMDRLSGDYRTFRFDRLAAYRVSNASGRYRVPRPDHDISHEMSPAAPARSVDRATGYDPAADDWAAWLEATYDPDAPIPYLPTPYAVPTVDRLEDLEV